MSGPKGPVPARKGKRGKDRPRGVPPRGSRPAGKVANPERVQAGRAARRRRQLWAGGATTVVVVVVAVVVALGLSASSPTPGQRVLISAAAVDPLTHVPVPTLIQASVSAGANLVPVKKITGPPLESGGKPEVLYIGAEFCPICATERWAMVVALSEFGTFTNLSETRSAVRDGNIGTFSFYGSTYSSPYLTFTPVETTTNVPQGNYYQTLQTPTPAQQALWSSLEGGGNNLTFPFIDIGGRYLLTSAQYSPNVVLGKAFSVIAGKVGDNSTSIGSSIDAAGAAFAKYLCSITGDRPASVCHALTPVTAPVSSSSSGPSSSTG